MTPYATTTTFTHENITAACPVCDHANTFNRVTDLRDTSPIDLKRVRCQACTTLFFINGDSINPTYEKLFFEACNAYRTKRFRESIIGLATSIENLLFAALARLLIDEPFAKEHMRDWKRFTMLHEQLRHRTERWTLASLRNALINTVARDSLSTDDATQRIRTLKPQLDHDALARIDDQRLSTLLDQLRALSVPRLRNQVLHKHAYRPTHDETAAAITETETVLYGLTVRLRLGYDDLLNRGHDTDLTSPHGPIQT